jgi:peptide/nickel transport system substrate-binding protein
MEWRAARQTRARLSVVLKGGDLVNGQQGEPGEGLVGKRLTRREALKGALLVGAGAALGPTLAACGGGGTGSSASSSPSASAAAKKGGKLRVGTVGGSAKDTADGQAGGATVPSIALIYQMYDALMGWNHDYQLENKLADEVTKNTDASKWTVRLKQGLEFHNGKTVTADDVIFSFKRIIDPKAPKTGSSSLSMLKASGIRKVDNLTVEFALTQPNAVFSEALGYYINCIIPVDFDPKNPVGTGPFKLTNFLPGEQMVFAPNLNYYGQVPWVDELTIIEFADTTARVNALLGGTVDAISDLPSAQVPVIQANSALRVLDAKTGAWQPITMRIDKKPFDDVRVRQAFKLIPDRKAMIEQAYGGFGSIGNDMYAPFDPGYPKDVPQREQDYEQAKSLLKAAGYDGLTVTLDTSDAIGSGVVAAAQVFAEMAKGAGVTVNINKMESGTFFGDQYTKWVFAQDFWYTHNYLTQATSASMPTAPYNDTHWKNDQWLKIVEEAFRTGDDAKRNDLVSEAQKIQFEQDGLLIWAFNDQVDAYSAKLGGVVPDKGGTPLSCWHLNEYYFI